MQALGGTRPEARRGRWAVFDQYARAGLARPPAFRLGDGLGTRWRRKSHRRSQRCVRAGRGLDHQTTRWAGQTVVGFIKDLSSGCVAISRGDRASCLGCGCHRPHMPGSGAACPGLRCPARSQGRLLSLYRLEARIIVVDPGFMVDPGYPRAPDPPRSPDPPRKPENPSAWRGGSGVLWRL